MMYRYSSKIAFKGYTGIMHGHLMVIHSNGEPEIASTNKTLIHESS